LGKRTPAGSEGIWQTDGQQTHMWTLMKVVSSVPCDIFNPMGIKTGKIGQ